VAVRKRQDTININVSQTNPKQVLISRYLRDSGNITAPCMQAINAYWYPIALAESSDSSEEEVELAFLVAERALLAQIEYLKDYQRIKLRANPVSEALVS
jgi:hypothetical protein